MAVPDGVLVRTRHVMCPTCDEPTYGPYFDPGMNDYFDGHYCEACGLTWRWNDSRRMFESSHG